MFPFAPFFIGALVVAVLPQRLRPVVALGVPVIGGWSLVGLPQGLLWTTNLFGYALAPVRVDDLSLLFGYLFHIAAFIAGLYALHVRDPAQQVAAMVYAGAALGAVFAGDLLTLFVFWELMAVSSAVFIWARRAERSLAIGLRYLIFQIGSGALLLAGALMLVDEGTGLAFTHLSADRPATWLILIAFGIKCAFPLLHGWLTEAYPEATPTGTVYLSVFTTKVAIYAMARGFAGTEALIYVGAVMTCFPIFYAVIENDLRRVLAYSMVNQLGFMICGIGIGTELALAGAVAHAFNDVIFKGLLMMSMGAVLHMTGRVNGSALGGLYKSMPVTTGLCLVGAASISAFPLFSGFVSKALVMSAVVEQGHTAVWLALLFASAGVFHHAGIKIPYFAFFAHDSGIRTTEPPLNMLLAMGSAAILCVAIGCAPGLFYQLIPYEIDYLPYTADHVITQLQLLLFSALAFAWLNLSGRYPPELPSVNIDVDWLYRRGAKQLLIAAGRLLAPVPASGRQVWRVARLGSSRLLARWHGPEAYLARSWSTSAMVLAALVILAWLLVGW